MAKIIEDILVGKKGKKDIVNKKDKHEVLSKGEIMDLIKKNFSKKTPDNLINSSDE